MRYFDLHCDTATEIYSAGKGLYCNGMNIDFAKADALEQYTQLFAVFIPDSLRGENAVQYFDDVYAHFNALVRQSPDVSFFKENADSKFQAILAVEGGSACGGTIEGVDHLAACGTAVMTLTWNGDNEIASGCFSKEDRGLTLFGKDVLRKMQQCNIIPDVSHLGKKSFADVVDFYDDVLIATHSNFDITENIYGKTRNLEPWQVREIIDRNGLIGVNFCADFLGDHGDTGFAAVCRHLEHFLDAGAQDVLALGSDYDGCTLHDELRGIDKIPLLYAYLLQHGFGKQILDKIFYENANRFFIHHLKKR